MINIKKCRNSERKRIFTFTLIIPSISNLRGRRNLLHFSKRSTYLKMQGRCDIGKVARRQHMKLFLQLRTWKTSSQVRDFKHQQSTFFFYHPNKPHAQVIFESVPSEYEGILNSYSWLSQIVRINLITRLRGYGRTRIDSIRGRLENPRIYLS